MSEKIHELLEKKYLEYNSFDFIEGDPISIPHRFSKKQDIEISGFFAATLAWGNRKSIITSASRLMEKMDHAPHDFILNHTEKDLKRFLDFKHRTFNATDTLFFLEFFKQFYKAHDSLEEAFLNKQLKSWSGELHTEKALSIFNERFFESEFSPTRSRKHVSTPIRGSTCKRLNMYLRWMVRKDKSGVDFGIWKKIKPAQLLCPLDVHVDRVGRSLGLIKSRQRNWKTVLELTEHLRLYDKMDPVKYDFALFGIGAMEKGKLIHS